MKNLGLWIYETYQAVFDHQVNPLKHIPDPMSRMFIMIVLATMWSGVFAFYLSSIVYFGYSVWAHVLLLGMVFFTAAVFHDAERNNDSWLLILRKNKKIPPVSARRCKWDLEKEG